MPRICMCRFLSQHCTESIPTQKAQYITVFNKYFSGEIYDKWEQLVVQSGGVAEQNPLEFKYKRKLCSEVTHPQGNYMATQFMNI